MTSMKLLTLTRKQDTSMFSCVNLSDPEQSNHLWQGMNFPIFTSPALAQPEAMNCVSAPLSVYWSALCVYTTAKISSQPAWHFSMNWLWDDTAKGQYAKEWPIQAWQILTETEYFRVWGACLDFSISTSDILSICILKISTCFTAMPPDSAARGAHSTVCSVDREPKKLNLPKIVLKKNVLLRYMFLPSKREVKETMEINPAFLRSMTWNLPGEKMSKDRGSLLSHHEVPWGHAAPAQSAALSSEIKTKALLGGSLRSWHLPQRTFFPAKRYRSSPRSLVKMSPLEG